MFMCDVTKNATLRALFCLRGIIVNLHMVTFPLGSMGKTIMLC